MKPGQLTAQCAVDTSIGRGHAKFQSALFAIQRMRLFSADKSNGVIQGICKEKKYCKHKHKSTTEYTFFPFLFKFFFNTVAIAIVNTLLRSLDSCSVSP